MKYIVSLVVAMSLVGCSSAPGAFSSRAHPLEGIVYTAGGAVLRGAHITLDGHASVWSDSDGRFTITRVRHGEHRLHAHHDGYEPMTRTVRFARPTDVLHLRMRSADDLAQASQQALDRGGTAEAEQLIARALAVSPDSIRVRYLAAIVYARAGRFDEADRMLDHVGFDSTLPAVRLLAERIAKGESR